MRLTFLASAGVVLALLGGCSNDPSRANVTKTLVQGVSAKVKKSEPMALPTAAQLKAAVTPEVRAQTGNQPLLIGSSLRVPVSAIMAMAAENGDVRTYLGTDGISFSLRSGVLVASRGLGTDLMSAEVSQVLPRIRAGSGQAVRAHRYLNGENQLVVREYRCTYSRAGGEVIEACSGEDASFENRYVLDRAGKIVISVQWVSPLLGSYRLEDIG